MDESLAKGYTKQFLTWYKEDLLKAIKERDQLLNKTKIFHDRSAFEKFSNNHKEQFKNFSLNYFLGGSKRHPFIALTTYHVAEEQYEDWNENHLLPSVFFIYFNKPLRIRSGMFSVSEHSIKRIYQRANIFNANNNDHYSIINEMSFIPIWAGFYNLFHILTNTKDIEIKQPIIPSPNGLFLCKTEVAKGIKYIHIRTYVGDKDLSETQLNLKNAMIQASKYLKNGLLGFMPLSVEVSKIQFLIDFELMLYALKDFIKEFLNEILKSDDDLILSILHRKIIERISEIGKAKIDLLNILTAENYREIAKLIEEGRLKKEVENINNE